MEGGVPLVHFDSRDPLSASPIDDPAVWIEEDPIEPTSRRILAIKEPLGLVLVAELKGQIGSFLIMDLEFKHRRRLPRLVPSRRARSEPRS